MTVFSKKWKDLDLNPEMLKFESKVCENEGALKRHHFLTKILSIPTQENTPPNFERLEFKLLVQSTTQKQDPIEAVFGPHGFGAWTVM